MIRLLTVLTAVVLMALPSTALAAAPESRAPAGNSAIDEYIETVPGASGATFARPPGTKGATTLTPSARARLERLGRDGQALAAAVDATAPATAPATGQRTALPDAAPSRSALRAVLDGAAGGDGGAGGMGMLLPAILLGSLLGAVGLVLARRHAAS